MAAIFGATVSICVANSLVPGKTLSMVGITGAIARPGIDVMIQMM